MMGEVLCSDSYTLTPNMEHIQTGVFCLLILFLDSLQCYRVNTLELNTDSELLWDLSHPRAHAVFHGL